MSRLTVFLIAAACASGALAAENGKKDNPLRKLPSKPNAEHVAKLRALGDNSWVILGQAAPCDRFPRKKIARGRSWCSKMAYAPDLGGAFFCGTGVHGAMPEGYYMDDLWFYDANAHKWICLYPGATKQTRCKLDKNGFEVDMAGNQVPISYLSHAYHNITYDTDRKKYFVFWTQCPWWGKAVAQRKTWLGLKNYNYGNAGKVIPNGKHPLFWDVKTGKWERRFVSGSGPTGRFEGVTEYIPSRKQTFRLHRGRVYFYDYAKNQWVNSGAKPVKMSYDSSGCYDPKSEKIYVAKAKTFYVYDLKANTWELRKAPGQPTDLGATNRVQMFFDTANDVVFWQRTRGPIVIYDPEANKWTDMGSTTPKIPWKRYNPKYMCWSGFYNAEFNAYFFYFAGDSGLNDANWLAYRYKKAEKKSEKK
jgi:hypothetical protein